MNSLETELTISDVALQTPSGANNTDTFNLDAQIVEVEAEPFLGDLSQLIPGVDEVLSVLQEAINGLVWSNSLPLVGKQLESVTNPAKEFITDIRDQILTQLGAIDDLGSEGVQKVREALFAALGPSGLNLLLDSDDAGSIINIDDIKAIEAADDVRFDLSIGGTPIDAPINLDFDTGLSALGFKVEGDVQASLGFQYDLSFGVNVDGIGTNSFYYNTAGTDELGIDLDITTPGLNAAATLGFFKFNVKDEQAADGDTLDPTKFSGDFKVDLKGGGSDNKLTVAELGGLTLDNFVDAKLDGSANINLNLVTDLGTAVLPSILGDFNLGWSFDNADADKPGQPLVNFGNTPTIAFNDIGINLGTFFSDFVEDVLGGVQDATAPIQPIVDVLTTRLPVLDDLGRGFLDFDQDNKVTLLDVVNLFKETVPELGYISEIARIANLLEAIPTDVDDVVIDLGSFQLSGAGSDARDLGFDLKLSDRNQQDAAEVSEQLDNINTPGAQEAKDFLDQLAGADGSSLQALDDGFNPQFPILDNPSTVFDLLLGKNVDLFTYDLPALGFNVPFEQFFPIIGPLGALLRGELGGKIDLAFGYDALGLQQFAANGFDNPGDVFNGFFINDLKDGVDVAEAELTAGIKAFAAIEAGLFSAGAGGGITATIGANLNDKDNDGKVRQSDLEDCLFELQGRLDAVLEAFIKFGFSPFSYTKRFNLAKATLLSFAARPCDGEDDPTQNKDIVTNIGNGVYRLNIGPSAGVRLINGQPGQDVDEVFAVATNPDNAGQTDFTFDGITRDFNDVTQIVGNGGNINDAIVIGESIVVPTNLQGGAGNDQLFGGSSRDTLSGDADSDGIQGGAGNDSLLGGAGEDYLEGGAGADTLDGGADFDEVSYISSAVGITLTPQGDGSVLGTGGDAQGDRLTNIEQLTGSNFQDTLNGNSVGNTIEGLDGNDELRGNGGNDFLLGGLGADLIDGGASASTSENGGDGTSYLASSAPIFVNLATGSVAGGDATGDTLISIEDVQGSAFNDVLIGSSSKNRIDGFFRDDRINGGAGADILDGGEGIDTALYNSSPQAVNISLKEGLGKGFGIFNPGGGDGGGDLLLITADADSNAATIFNSFENLEGSPFADILEGDSGQNTLTGLNGNDTLKGDEGNDTLIGRAGADSLDGGGSIDLANYRQSSAGVVVNLQTGIGTGGDAAGDTFTRVSGVSTVENLLGSDFADNLAGDTGVNDIDPGLSNSGTDFVNGGFNLLLDDRLLIDYSRNDTGTGITGGFNLNTFDSGFISRNIKGTNTILDAVSYFNIERLRLIGTTQNDQIFSGFKDDQLFMGAGNDTINGGQGSNTIRAEDGNDVVIDQDNINRNFAGTPGDSLIDLDGGRGIDTLSIDLTGKSVENTFFVVNVVLESTNPNQERNQKFTSNQGTVAISNFEIFKEIETDFGFDRLVQLGKVDNKFSTGNANDAVNAGLGFDTVDGGSDSLDGGFGGDLLTIDYSVGDTGGGMIMTPGDGESGIPGKAFRFISTLPNEDQLLDQIEFFSFERFQITGTTKGDSILTRSASGNDTVNGGAGNDTVNDSTGIDSLDGGAGFDILSDDLSDKSYNVVLSNFDIGEINLEGPDGTSIKNFEAFQNIRTGSGNDTLVQLGKLDNNFNTGKGNDFVNAGLGFDTVDGDAFLETEASNDLLVINYSSQDTGSGMEMFFGGEGSSSEGSAFRFVSTLPGEDQFLDRIEFDNFERFQVIGTSKDDSIVTAGFANGNDVVTGGAGNDFISTRGGNDTLNGGVGADFLDGGVGGDQLSGNENDDTISGNSGNDNLLGGSGNDILRGTNNFSTDIDTLTGGIGADKFELGELFFGATVGTLHYDTAGNNDFALITDFNPTEGDTISLPTCGNGGSYSLGTPAPGLPSGIAIFGRNSVSGANDLIAIVQGIPALNLNDPAFSFFGAACSTLS